MNPKSISTCHKFHDGIYRCSLISYSEQFLEDFEAVHDVSSNPSNMQFSQQFLCCFRL